MRKGRAFQAFGKNDWLGEVGVARSNLKLHPPRVFSVVPLLRECLVGCRVVIPPPPPPRHTVLLEFLVST
jgi:hypothetical protein